MFHGQLNKQCLRQQEILRYIVFTCPLLTHSPAVSMSYVGSGGGEERQSVQMLSSARLERCVLSWLKSLLVSYRSTLIPGLRRHFLEDASPPSFS